MAELLDIYDIDRNKTGRLHERGAPLSAGECVLVVQVWILNGNGELLISKRAGDWHAGMWQTTGGCAVAGEGSLSAALRETKEELGVDLDPKNGQLFKQYSGQSAFDQGGVLFDIWLFRQEAPISSITLHPGETCGAMWASEEKIRLMIRDGIFIAQWYPYIEELFYFLDKPFWEIGYRDKTVSTFAKGPTADIAGFHMNFKQNSRILDAGCGEGRNAVFLAERGHTVDAFDISEAGIGKAKAIAAGKGLSINFFVCDLRDFIFNIEYDAVLSHGVLHLPEKAVRDRFIAEAQEHTVPGGFNAVGIFTNRLPATPDNAPFTKSLFDVGELPAKYAGWEILSHDESTFCDSHPGGVSHEHAYERIIAKRR